MEGAALRTSLEKERELAPTDEILAKVEKLAGAGNDFAAYQAETFLAERTPLPKLIEPAQHIQFICV